MSSDFAEIARYALCACLQGGGGIEVRNFLQFSAYDIAIPAVGVEAGGGGELHRAGLWELFEISVWH